MSDYQKNCYAFAVSSSPEKPMERTQAALMKEIEDDFHNGLLPEAFIKARQAVQQAWDERDMRDIEESLEFIHQIAPLLDGPSLQAEAWETIASFAKGHSEEEIGAVNAWTQLMSAAKGIPFSAEQRISIAWRAATCSKPHYLICREARRLLNHIHEDAEAAREERRQKNIDIDMFRLNAKPLRARRKFEGPESERYIHIARHPEPI